VEEGECGAEGRRGVLEDRTARTPQEDGIERGDAHWVEQDRHGRDPLYHRILGGRLVHTGSRHTPTHDGVVGAQPPLIDLLDIVRVVEVEVFTAEGLEGDCEDERACEEEGLQCER
jgi:hypothetical protein